MSPVRGEIQALRAAAVVGVLLFHLWPGRLTGGYVGVDVFFVVSGFLITDHLVRELERSGTVSLTRFWARRARRLLPASLIVLLFTAAAVYLWVPLGRWQQIGVELVAAAFYGENWALAAQSVDYMATSNMASPVQHFWTLGVEEQFYLVWPLLMLLGAVVAPRFVRGGTAGVTAVVGAVTVASFGYSVIYTALVPDVAYYSTFTRAWEFGAGALLSLGVRKRDIGISSPAFAAVQSWLGWLLIAAGMIMYTGATPFPSFTAALPVIGTLAVIAAGTPRSRWAPTYLMSLRPVRFVGDVSYGTYLWHWPLIVLLPFVTLEPLSTWQLISVGALSILLGWGSKRFVEDPIRSHRWLGGSRPRRSLLGAFVGMLLVVAVSLPQALSSIPPPPSISTVAPRCAGAASMVEPSCGGPLGEALDAPPESFANDLPASDVRACELTVELASYRRCDRVARKAGKPNIALVGDSHATRWVETFERAAEDEGWGLSTFLVSGCPLVSQAEIGGVWGYDPVGAKLCPRSTGEVLDEIAGDPGISHVVFNNRTRLYISADPANRPLSADAVAQTIQMLQHAGKTVLVLKDPPEMRQVPRQGGGSAPDCLALRPASECGMPRTESEFDDPMVAAAGRTGADVIDFTDLFCDSKTCYWQIGGLAVYTDDNHLTRSFAATLADPLTERLRSILTDQ